MTKYARQFRKIARKLGRAELMRQSMEALFAEDAADLLESRSTRRFLGFYGDAGLQTAFRSYGLFGEVEELGYGDFELTTHADDERHTLIVRGRHDQVEGSARLFEIAARRDRLVFDESTPHPSRRDYDILTVDWVLLQHPVGEFTTRRPRLPGQDAPGLGLGEAVAELFNVIIGRLELDAWLTTAAHFHNAVIYRRELRHIDPRAEGRCIALERALLEQEELSLPEATWAVELGCVEGVEGVFEWTGEAQVGARARELRDYFGSEAYQSLSSEVARTVYRLDRARFQGLWSKLRPELVGPASSDAFL